jgi:hypothetical protein
MLPPCHVAGERGGIGRARMGTREYPAAKPAVADEVPRFHDLYDRLDLHVAQLPKVIVAAPVAVRPAEKDVTCRLHQPLANDDSLAVVVVHAPARKRLEHRRACLFDLQEQRIAFARLTS